MLFRALIAIHSERRKIRETLLEASYLKASIQGAKEERRADHSRGFRIATLVQVLGIL